MLTQTGCSNIELSILKTIIKRNIKSIVEVTIVNTVTENIQL